MPEITKVEEATRDGEDGFEVTWMMRGFSESGAKFRAAGMTAMRFPTTITELEVVTVREFDERDFNVTVFVPTRGFPSAGITNPVKWARSQFGERFMNRGESR